MAAILQVKNVEKNQTDLLICKLVHLNICVPMMTIIYTKSICHQTCLVYSPIQHVMHLIILITGPHQMKTFQSNWFLSILLIPINPVLIHYKS